MSETVTTIAELLAKHPLPWSVHPDYPRTSMSSDDDGVVMDAAGERVMHSAEWFLAGEGVVEQIVSIVNVSGAAAKIVEGNGETAE